LLPPNAPPTIAGEIKKIFDMEITFEKLPQAVSRLMEKLEDIEKLLLTRNNQQLPEEDRILTISEAAELLHLTVPSVYRLVRQQEIPVSKRSKRLYFSKKELTAWIQTGRRRTTAEIRSESENFQDQMPGESDQ
jgi:excisionase family DNA binding protein